MFRYVILMNLTDQGRRDIKESPARLQAATEALEAAGGKLTGYYLTQGQYDYVAIAEVPTEEIGLAQLGALAAAGSVTTNTMRAYTTEEMAGLYAALG